jgi:propanol-preferring alcohol dehydrogenase
LPRPPPRWRPCARFNRTWTILSPYWCRRISPVSLSGIKIFRKPVMRKYGSFWPERHNPQIQPGPETMRAMLLLKPGEPLQLRDVPVPTAEPGQLLLKVSACAVCRTDLHVVDGELPNPKLPLIPGHEIVGRVEAVGDNVTQFKLGDRVGVPWLGWTCGTCEYCRTNRENLCDDAKFIGYTLDGGYADYMVADARYCFSIPNLYSDSEAAPLMCAGLIGYRSLVKTGVAKRLGIYGFGAAAHIVAQVARYQGRQVFAFTRPEDVAAQELAKSLGAVWAGNSGESPPEPLDAAIIFAPVGELVRHALRAVKKGGTVVCGGIHMSDIPSFPYELLWQERTICSVANLTRRDGIEFFALAPRARVKTQVQEFPLAEANQALDCLRKSKLQGAAVLMNV